MAQSQIEKELLTVVHSCEHFYYYVYGQHIVIKTDHKTLLRLEQNPFDEAVILLRLQRLMIRLQRYNFTLTHVPGKQVYVIDAISRNLLSINLVVTTYIDNVHLIVSVIDHA